MPLNATRMTNFVDTDLHQGWEVTFTLSIVRRRMPAPDTIWHEHSRQHVKFLLRQCTGKRFLCAATPRKMDPCTKYIGQIQHGFHLGFWLPIFAFSQHKCLTELLNFAHKTHTTFISAIWIIESSRLKRARNLPPEVSSRRRVQTTTFICMKKYYRHVLEMEWGAERPKLRVAMSFKNNTTFAQGK